jgi:hypothetical protein
MHNLAWIDLVHTCSEYFAYILLRNVIMITMEATV